MQLFIQSANLHVLDVASHETVGDVKRQVAALDGLVAEDIAIYCSGRPMEDSDVLALCAGDLTTLNVEVRMVGGKVHGSLARAGKVKGQTPKVEKGEKKKKRTGRSKRRMQYNRRFVNVVATFGRKKGPNSNTQ